MFQRFVSIGIKVAIILALIPFVLVPVYAFVPPVSTTMLWRLLTRQPVAREWRPLEEISPNLVRAVIAAEDARYCTHHGVDWIEVGHAIDDADDLGDARGASTIPMQTAKNLFLWQGHHLVRKALEVPLAYYISFMWTKRRLIEVYLNVAEWGPNGEFGAEAAARHAFRKSAYALLPDEAAMLAAVLPNPVQRNAARPSPGLIRLVARYRAEATLAGSPITTCLAR
ncbi:MAG TPA: monofunctional biosynthetic peptidoglycan transglycosylase [Xanthobacteraceae bacterium]|nr:monofunctional biosynthetic peptidoglycan transglycosylase [Xanthobacteraceae bacterium]